MTNPAHTPVALLPCPFCGGSGDFCETSVWWVRCDECGADAESDSTPEKAARRWNRRAYLSAVGGEAGELARLREENETYRTAFDGIEPARLKAQPGVEGEWHRLDGDDNILLYTLVQDGWRKGKPVMVNDVTIRIEAANGSRTSIGPIADRILPALTAPVNRITLASPKSANPAQGVTDGPINQQEMVALFGSEMPMEAVNLLYECPDDWTTSDLRRKLREIAAMGAGRHPTPTPTPITEGEPSDAEVEQIAGAIKDALEGYGISREVTDADAELHDMARAALLAAKSKGGEK